MLRDGDIVSYNGILYKVCIYWEDMGLVDIRPVSGGKLISVWESNVIPIDTFQQRYDQANKEFLERY